MTAADDIRKITGQNNYPQLRMMAVIGIGDDGLSVILNTGSSSNPATAPCVVSYTDRQVGDQVLVAQLSRKNWLVLGVPGQQLVIPDPAPPVIPPTVTVMMSETAPTGTGWQQASVLPFVRDDGNGARSVYFQLGTPPPPPSQPPAQTPKPVSVAPNAIGSYRTTGQTDPGLIQGDWYSTRWWAAMFYGSDITAAIGSNTVDSMTLTVARLDDTSGWNRSINVHCGSHSRGTKGPVTSLDNVHVLGGLQHGEQKTFTLPDDIVAALKSGDGLGFGDTDDYVKFTDNTGKLTITFA